MGSSRRLDQPDRGTTAKADGRKMRVRAPTPPKERALANENTWQWIARNHLKRLPENWIERNHPTKILAEKWTDRKDLKRLPENTVELEPDKVLVAMFPFRAPIEGQEGYSAGKEALIARGGQMPDGGKLVRVFRRGMFVGYKEISPR
jgi:hypothetical protein